MIAFGTADGKTDRLPSLSGGSRNPLQTAKMLSCNPVSLIPVMILKLHDTFIGGSEPSLDRQDSTAPDVTVKKVSITPERKEHVISGLGIEVTESELLAVVPRKRRRTEAYDALVKYLSEERNILLTIKSRRQ